MLAVPEDHLFSHRRLFAEECTDRFTKMNALDRFAEERSRGETLDFWATQSSRHWDGVGDDHLLHRRCIDALDCGAREDTVRCACNHFNRAGLLNGAYGLCQRSARVNLVVNNHDALPLHVTDDVQHFGMIIIPFASLLDDRERCI